MSSKNKQKVDMKSIKEYEKSMRSEAPKAAPEASPIVSFDEWWLNTLASAKLHPSMKEILKADAKGRGLEGQQTAEKWNWAAKQFGLSI